MVIDTLTIHEANQLFAAVKERGDDLARRVATLAHVRTAAGIEEPSEAEFDLLSAIRACETAEDKLRTYLLGEDIKEPAIAVLYGEVVEVGP